MHAQIRPKSINRMSVGPSQYITKQMIIATLSGIECYVSFFSRIKSDWYCDSFTTLQDLFAHLFVSLESRIFHELSEKVDFA